MLKLILFVCLVGSICAANEDKTDDAEKPETTPAPKCTEDAITTCKQTFFDGKGNNVVNTKGKVILVNRTGGSATYSIRSKANFQTFCDLKSEMKKCLKGIDCSETKVKEEMKKYTMYNYVCKPAFKDTVDCVNTQLKAKNETCLKACTDTKATCKGVACFNNCQKKTVEEKCSQIGINVMRAISADNLQHGNSKKEEEDGCKDLFEKGKKAKEEINSGKWTQASSTVIFSTTLALLVFILKE